MFRQRLIHRAIAPLAFTAFCGHARAQFDVPATSIDLDQAKNIFEEAQALSDADGGRLWGAEVFGPTLLVNPATRFVVANVPDRGGLLEERTGVWTGTLPNHINVANTTTDWSGVRWAMITWPLVGHSQERGCLVLHESFHRMQRDVGFKLAMGNCVHLDGESGRVWLRLELRALAAAMQADDPLRSEAIHDALTFRAYRRALIPAAAKEEREVERNEGMAEYTGLRLSGYDHESQWRRTTGQLKSYDDLETYIRSFAYVTGPAYCLLLDEAKPDEWRSVMQSNDDRDFGDVLASAVGFRAPRHIGEEARRRAEPYQGDAVIAEEHARAEERAERLASFQSLFVDGPTLRLPMTGETRFQFDPHTMSSFDGYGTVYSAMRITGEFGVFETKGRALWVREFGDNNNHWRIPMPTGENEDADREPLDLKQARLETDDWTLTLNDGWRARPLNRKGDCTVEPVKRRGR